MGIYNCAPTLQEALDSLYAQTYQDFEIILCEDGSKDNTYEIALENQKQHDNIVLLRNPHNMGLNQTLNNCLAVAKGEYIARMDGDDLCDPTRFEKQVNSLYGFLNISYKNFLFMDFTGRNDWSSTLPMDNNSYFYPSATISFIATEAFKINWGPISFLKIRGSAATTASDDLPYQLDFTYNTGSFGGQLVTTLPTQVPPLQLKPQRQRSFEIGLDIGLWDKFNMDVTYYDIYSWDQILASPMCGSSGSSSARINTGIVTNKGIEAIMNYNVFQKADSYLQVGLNLARNTNRIVDLGGADMYILSEVWGSNGPAIAVQEGEQYGTI